MWGIEGEKKYISAYDAVSYPKMNMEKVEKIIEEKEGETVLTSREKGGRWDLDTSKGVKKTIGIESKYAVYLDRQQKDIQLYQKSNALKIPSSFNFNDLPISQEEKDKLVATQPGSIEEVKQILGIKPSTLLFIIKAVKKSHKSWSHSFRWKLFVWSCILFFISLCIWTELLYRPLHIICQIHRLIRLADFSIC